MSPSEFWWLAEAKRPRKVYAGGMSENEVAELHDELSEMGVLNG